MSGEQDMRTMGGIWKLVPLTYIIMWVGSLSLAGVFPFAGYYSKDAILEAAYAASTGIGAYGFWCCLIAAFLTAFYSWRLLILTFHGTPRADAHTMEHVHESPPVMTMPLVLLAIGAHRGRLRVPRAVARRPLDRVLGPVHRNRRHQHVLHDMETLPGWVGPAPSVVGLAGIAVAYLFYMAFPAVPAQLAARFRRIYLFLLNKWYFDELYDRVFVRPSLVAARVLWQVGDATLIDGVPERAGHARRRRVANRR